MKPLDKIERLAEIADSINYHERQLLEYTHRENRLINANLITSNTVNYLNAVRVYNRLLRVLELKYNRVLTEIK